MGRGARGARAAARGPPDPARLHPDGAHRGRAARPCRPRARMAGARRQCAARSGLDRRRRRLRPLGADVAGHGRARCLPLARAGRGRRQEAGAPRGRQGRGAGRLGRGRAHRRRPGTATPRRHVAADHRGPRAAGHPDAAEVADPAAQPELEPVQRRPAIAPAPPPRRREREGIEDADAGRCAVQRARASRLRRRSRGPRRRPPARPPAASRTGKRTEPKIFVPPRAPDDPGPETEGDDVSAYPASGAKA